MEAVIAAANLSNKDFAEIFQEKGLRWVPKDYLRSVREEKGGGGGYNAMRVVW
jgi:hypothetical protein